MLDIYIRDIFIRRNVVFYEDIFPYINLDNNTETLRNKEGENVFFDDFLYGYISAKTQNHVLEIDNDNDDQTKQLEPTKNEEIFNDKNTTFIENHNN